MSLYFIDEAYNGRCGYFHKHTLSSLQSSLLEPVDPSGAISKTFRLAHLLLLSNHVDQAYSLLCALYEYSGRILPGSSRLNQDSTPYSSPALQYFWQTHPTYSRPENTVHIPQKHQNFATEEEVVASAQWHSYRECTRTGWMLEHCNLPEPENPHVWDETDDAPLIAMCSRLLAKNKTPGEYPPQEQMREALNAAKKLYAQPQVPITEWKTDWRGNMTVRRHSYLLYRRLVVELAIRLGELDTAAEVLGSGLRLDGFNSIDGAQLEKYLFVSGIYDVLPRLAERGKEGNPFFIEKRDAEALVLEMTKTLELRAREGRQWSLAPEKVGWDELLHRLAKGAWKVNRKGYRRLGIECATEILFEPASEEEIRAAEAKVGELPLDFKEMVRVADG